MSKDKVLLIGVDLGNEKDCQCATLDLYYKDTDHIIYQTTDKEQVVALNEILEDINAEKTKLQRLEAIDNANPSEALECLEKIKDGFGCDMAYYDLNLEYETVEQALLKAQEQEKVLSIIKEKKVDVCELKICIDEYDDSLYQYNKRNIEQFKLTPEEFDAVKRWVK